MTTYLLTKDNDYGRMQQCSLPFWENTPEDDWKDIALRCGIENHALRMEVYSLKEKLDKANKAVEELMNSKHREEN